jgi:hypothetical protein
MKKVIWFALGAMLFALCSQVKAQQSSTIPRIGYLGGPSAAAELREGLRARGWIEGQNILIEYRFAGAKPEQLSEFAAELVRLKADVIVAISTPAAQAARKATDTIPIVFSMVSDPVASGLVISLARPGGNATGLSNMLPEQSGKLLELLKEAAPGVSRVAVVWDSANPGKILELKDANRGPAVGYDASVTRNTYREGCPKCFFSDQQDAVKRARHLHRCGDGLSPTEDRRFCRKEPAAINLSSERFCLRRRPDVLWSKPR